MKKRALPKLNRSVSFLQLFLFGLGTIVGGGFYALLGKISGVAGIYTPFSFFLAGLTALFSALSYAELSSRFPYAGGEAYYTETAFSIPTLTRLIGWLVIVTGVISSSTMVVASAGFIQDLTDLDTFIGILLVAVLLTTIAIIGIRLSMGFVAIITIIEVGALAFILLNTTDILLETTWAQYVPPFEFTPIIGALGGTFLAFYAFIGFEDMVNVSEEVKQVRRNMPWAILAALIISTTLYILVSVSSLNLVSIETLSSSNTPLAVVMTHWGSVTTLGIILISLLAGLNGALVQIVMASRVTYGMAQAGRAPQWMGEVHANTRTPLKGTLMIGGIVLMFALFFPLVTLAKGTSVLILIVFFTVNCALIRIKVLKAQPSQDSHLFPVWVPYLGAATTGIILFYSVIEVLGFAQW